jgi:DNA repair protein RadC
MRMRGERLESDRIKNWPKSERPRERVLAGGAEQASDADLLAVILRVGCGTFQKGVRGQNVADFARSLIAQFGSLRGLDRARVEDLLKVSGLGPAKIAQLKAAFELGKRICVSKLISTSFSSSASIAKHFRPQFVGKGQETVFAVFLNGQNQLLGEKEITQGTPTQSTVYVRQILEEALHLSAAAIVLVHNHPSGCPEPSTGDDKTTNDLKSACDLIGLVLLDHVIIGEDHHYSYSDEGRLNKSDHA